MAENNGRSRQCLERGCTMHVKFARDGGWCKHHAWRAEQTTRKNQQAAERARQHVVNLPDAPVRRIGIDHPYIRTPEPHAERHSKGGLWGDDADYFGKDGEIDG